MAALASSEYTVAVEENTAAQYRFQLAPEGSFMKRIWNEKIWPHRESNIYPEPFDFTRLTVDNEQVAVVMMKSVYERNEAFPCQVRMTKIERPFIDTFGSFGR